MSAIFSAMEPETPVSISSKMIVGSFTAPAIMAFSESMTRAISPPDATETGTNSHIRRLTDEERVKEIANMLSGATLTEAALNNAKALISG